jgi:transcriptional regulator with XRE-family HTH domain
MDASAKQVAGIVGPRIRRIRRGLDMSQEALADNAGIHRTQMTGFEWGERLPRIDTLIKLAGGLGVSPCELLDGIVWEPQGIGREARLVEIEGSGDESRRPPDRRRM